MFNETQIELKLNGQTLTQPDSANISELNIADGDLLVAAPAIATDVHHDVKIQREIENTIRKQNVDHNMAMAIEHFPEAFGTVTMLFVACKVNGHPIKAFVDTGAQMTLMSQACAQSCGVMRLMDDRFVGIAMGVGTQKIIGRVHLAQLQISTAFLSTSFSVLKDQVLDVIIGLDMLKRHQCVVDLHQNRLVVKSSSGDVSTPFLPERDIPRAT